MLKVLPLAFLLGTDFSGWPQDEAVSSLSPHPTSATYYSSDGGAIIRPRKNPKQYRSGGKRSKPPQNPVPDEVSEASFTFLQQTCDIDTQPFIEVVQEGTENISDDMESDYGRKQPQSVLPNPPKQEQTQYQFARDGHDLVHERDEEINPLLGHIPKQRYSEAIQ